MPKWESVKNKPNIYRYKNKNDKKYKYGVRRTYQLPGQKRAEFTKSGFASASDAQTVLNKFNAYLYSNKVKPRDKANMTFNQCYEEMRDIKVNSGKWRATTLKTNDMTYKKNVAQAIGPVKLKNLNRSDYQKYINGLAKQGAALTYLKQINRIIQSVVNYAEYNDYVVKNKIRHIDIPKNAKPAKNMTLEEDDYKLWFKTAKEILNPYYYSILRLLTLGERRGELLGLRYESFEKITSEDGLMRYKIIFDQARVAGKDSTELKTTSSNRYIIANEEMNEDIQTVLRESKKIRLKKGTSVNLKDYVVISVKKGLPISPMYINILFKKVSEKCGIKIHPHMLRHYFATVALQSNVNAVSVMRWLGHSKIDMTNSYVRPNESFIEAVSDEISGKF